MFVIWNSYKQEAAINILLPLSTIALNVYLLKSKSEALEKFVIYKNEVKNQLNKKIKLLRSDRGGKYEELIGEFYAQHGIIHE